MSGFLTGKKAVVLGVANDFSLAYGIAEKLIQQGAQVALSYPNEAILKRVAPIKEKLGADFLFELDVTVDDHINSLEAQVRKHWESVDIIVHSIAFAERDDLKNTFVETSKSGFLKAMEISCYSLISVTKALLPLLSEQASIMTLSYYGSEKVIKNYNVMGVAKAALEASVRYLANDLGERGVRVNAISAGPVKTLAASGISGFRGMLKNAESVAPLRKNVTKEDVGDTAIYLASSLSQSVTGQVIYVDSGLSILGGVIEGVANA